MIVAEQVITRLEESVRKMDKVTDILLYLTTVDERKSTMYNTLLQIEEQVALLNDKELTSLYGRLIEGHRSFLPKYDQVIQTDHSDFMKRLVKLAQESSVAANEADIELKKIHGLDSSTGIWGGPGWHPFVRS